ncbi:MAG: CBS domain-containing protein [Deltaproteobacteria bacterium]|nr:CBS domain-containing protein [Deltaproteobacteria bacterium]
MPYYPKDEFKKLAEEVKSSGHPHRLTVRELLNYYHQDRRGQGVVSWIRSDLSELGLECNPDFDGVFLDGHVELRKKPTVKSQKANAPDAEATLKPDPVQRLTLLPAANRPPVTIHRDADLQRAITLMLLHDYSQLPVMQNERDVDGMVSWSSIVSARAFGSECQLVRDCLIKEVEILPHETPLFDAVKTVMTRHVVLVRAQDRRIVGLVTISDIGEQFISFAEPFMILEQIEYHIRFLLEGEFTSHQLRAAIDPSDSEREVEVISDLSFGEYVRLFENPDHWKILNLSIDRGTFTKRLDKVRRIRNDVMHFHPDGISDADLEILRETGRFFDAFTRFHKKA